MRSKLFSVVSVLFLRACSSARVAAVAMARAYASPRSDGSPCRAHEGA